MLQSEFGPFTIASLRVHNRPTTVYNLEVHGEHVYQVGELGLLVHNAFKLPIDRIAKHGSDDHDSLMKGIAKYLEGDLGIATVRTNQLLTDGTTTLSSLRPDVQWIDEATGKINIIEINLSGGSGYANARFSELAAILGNMMGTFDSIPF